MPESISRHPLIWIDCEMTGLNPDTEEIMEIACFVTDAQLNLLEPEGLIIAVHLDESRLDQMGEWCTQTHRETGLTKRCIDSKISPEDAADQLLAYVQNYAPETRRALLAGNTVHADRGFLRKAPYDRVMKHLHHRIFDVSSIKEAARRWADEDVLKQSPQKKGLHEAKQDILESIEEARFYRNSFFLGSQGCSSSAGPVSRGED